MYVYVYKHSAYLIRMKPVPSDCFYIPNIHKNKQKQNQSNKQKNIISLQKFCSNCQKNTYFYI